MAGTLFIVATPIGNLEDITFRAVRVLGEVELIAAEDTRRTRKLLNHLTLKKKVISFNEHNSGDRVKNIVEKLSTIDIALVTDAGTPCISDPGASLVAECYAQGIKVVSVPGASSLTASMAVSGFTANEFLFLGFLARTTNVRKEILERHKTYSKPIVIFEAPHRIQSLLAVILETFGNRELAICRELTKLHEEIFRGTVKEASEFFENPRGEFVLVILGNSKGSIEKPPDIEVVKKSMEKAKIQGFSRSDAAKKVSKELGVSRRSAYRFWETE